MLVDSIEGDDGESGDKTLASTDDDDDDDDACGDRMLSGSGGSNGSMSGIKAAAASRLPKTAEQGSDDSKIRIRNTVCA